MRAALLGGFGNAPEAADVSPPEGGSGLALVRVTAAPINRLDLLIGSGTFYGGTPEPPYVPGVEGVGSVIEAQGLEPGTRVWFSFQRFDGLRGSMAELCAVDEQRTVVIEHDLDDGVAAAIGLTGLAAWMSLSRRGRLESGEQVLVLGAAGAVGQIALQAARILGARRVIGASRSDEGMAVAERLGADAVVDCSGGDVDTIAARIEGACDGPLALVLDPVWGGLASAALRALSPGGRLVNLGSSAGPVAPLESAVIRSKSLSVLGYTNVALSFDDIRAGLRSLHGHAAEGRITPIVDRVGLDDVGFAWARAGDSPHRKLVVAP
ncbi:MAG: quinone oxidoreductase family protein [Actinomycetota bacterium]